MSDNPQEPRHNVRRIGGAWMMTLGFAGMIVLLVLGVMTWLG